MARFRFGAGASDTILNPMTAVLLLIAIVLILSQPRKRAVVPFLFAYFTIPYGQVIVLAGVHFTVLQILILTVLARMLFVRGSSSEGIFAGGFNAIDKVVVLWSLLALIAFVLQWMEMQALIKAMGDLVLDLGGYLAARFLIPDRETLRRAIKVLATICVIQGVCMTSELYTNRNVFGSMGANSPTVRDGHIRAEGAMGGLYAGTLAGTSIPLFLSLWTDKKSRMPACAGFLGATAMAFASHASTSWLAYGGSLVGLSFWVMRKRMRLVRWGIVVTLVGLHLVMHGPVWSLIEKVDLTGGSSSYHRYMLVDNCIRHFGDWWLIGYRFYGDWGFDMWDLCNQFVAAALTGGLATLVTFIMVYTRSFGAIGTARREMNGDLTQEWFFWCMGSALFANVVASFGINYINHLLMYFLVLLVGIAVTTLRPKQDTAQAAQAPRQQQFASVPG